jgi:secreted trypsin-like serine protease
MQQPTPNYAIQAPAAASNSSKIAIIVSLLAIVFVGICVIALGLGVGLGIGRKNTSNNPTTTTSCVYNSSSTACGCAATQPTFTSARIINGYTATAHSWPWMVALYYQGNFICGGFLAESYQFVITAAHCVYGFQMSSMTIYAGLQTRSSLSSGQYRNVSNWEVNPNYYSSSTSILNDIAVIKLSSSFDMNDNVGLCCLPSGSTSVPTVGESAVIIGWGETISGDTSSVSDNLLQAVIEIQSSSSYCDVTSTSATQFCAGYGTTDTCQGDSGSPLMTSINNLWTCTGIVSFGLDGCGHSGYYTRVSYFRSFIDNATLYL